MAIPENQVAEIKAQLIAQIDGMPNENKEQIKEYVEGLDASGLEGFLKQNNIEIGDSGGIQQAGGGGGQNSGGEGGGQGGGCIFCSITKGEVPSYKLDENDKSIAILELNPLSKGHSLVLPKEHLTTEKIPKSGMTLAQKLAKRIKKKFKAEDVKIETSGFQGHSFINIIPIYKDTGLEKKKAEEKDLLELQKKLEIKKRAPRTKKPKENTKNNKETSEKKSNLPEIGFRIP